MPKVLTAKIGDRATGFHGKIPDKVKIAYIMAKNIGFSNPPFSAVTEPILLIFVILVNL